MALPAADKDSASPASVRKRLGSLQSESDELEYLCKFKGRAHIHSRWLSTQEIVADGRLSAQRLGNYEKKKLAGELDRFNEQCLTVERVLAVDGGAGAKRKGGPDGAVPGAIDAGDSPYRPPYRALAEGGPGTEASSGGDGGGPSGDAEDSTSAAASGGGGGGRRRRYFIKWLSLTYDMCTWEEEEDVPSAAVDAFHQRQVAFRTRCIEMAKAADAGAAPSTKATGKRKLGASDGGGGGSSTMAVSELPEGVLQGERSLRSYQLDGLRWLRHNYAQGRSVILGDEMGLGKTAQAVCMLQCVRMLHGAQGPLLVVVPLSTLPHWTRELAEWTSLDTVVFYGNKDARAVLVQYEWSFPPSGAEGGGRGGGGRGGRRPTPKQLPKFDVCVTTYEMLTANLDVLKPVRWEYMIVDEAHRLKNRDAKALLALRELDCPVKLALTGTPLQNHVAELWSMLNFLEPDTFEELDDFLEQYGDMQSAAQVQGLTEVLRPYLLRRTKADVDLGLTPMEETLIRVEITNFQKRCYRAILERNRSVLLRGSEASGAGPSFNNVSMQLRHCCNHPFLIKGVVEAEGLEGADNATWLDNLIAASGKMLLLDKLLPHLREQGHRVLLFSQFTMLLDLIEEYVELRGFSYERLDGSVTGDKRQAAIDRYCAPDSDTFLFLLGTRAGGVGINLTAADTVIIYDPDWNPQNDLQAQARCHRIGQTKLVRIYRLVTRDTYEMHLLDAANQKLGLEHAVIGHGSYHNIEKGEDAAGEDALTQGGGRKKGMPFKAAEVEELLKHGAQKLFTQEHDDEIARFSAESIEQILQRCATTKTANEAEKGQSGGVFSQASFRADDEGEAMDLHDPDFWEKMLGAEAEAEDEGEEDGFGIRETMSGGVSRFSQRNSQAPDRLANSLLDLGFKPEKKEKKEE